MHNLKKKLDIAERKLESVEETAHKALNQAVTNWRDFVETNNTIKEQPKEINALKATLNDQIDRSLRSTLIFKGIPCEKTENSWEGTKNTLMNYLSTTFKWNTRCDRIPQHSFKKSIDELFHDIILLSASSCGWSLLFPFNSEIQQDPV